MADPGYDIYIVDDPVTGAATLGTDTCYLLSASTEAPATPSAQTGAPTGDANLDAYISNYFRIAGPDAVLYLQGVGDGTTLPEPAAAVGLLPKAPGQIVAPEQLTSQAISAIIGAVTPGQKVALFNGPVNAADADLATLSAAVIAAGDSRFAGLFGDYYVFQNSSGGTNVIPAALVVAALIARNDLALKNPNVAAAGLNGIVPGAIGLANPVRSDAAIATLKTAQVNCAKYVEGSFRNYGYRTLANLENDPLWWDMSGSRTVMGFAALAASIDEDFAFAPIDGKGNTLNRWGSRLKGACGSLYKIDALFGDTPADAYSVDTGMDVNTLAAIQAGEPTAQVRLKTSPFAEHLTTNVTRRGLAATV